MKVELLSHILSDQIRSALGELELPDVELLPHLSFTFAVEEVSRSCSHQLIRHRLASYSQQSQRFIAVRRLKEHTVVPETVADNAPQLFDAFIEAASETYQGLLERGVPREDARFVLPNATETSLLVTMDGRALLHFFGLRCCNRAQWEIRELADAMLVHVRAAEPGLYRGAGPYCYQLGRCLEGRFSCGKMQDVKEKYDHLA